MTYSDDLVQFIKRWESLKLVPSGDPLVQGVVDVGFGHVLRGDEESRRITEEEAIQLLEYDLWQDAEAIDEMVDYALEQFQFDALLSFTYNVGLGAFRGSTLRSLLNDGDFEAAAEQFPRWNKAGGKVVRGLTKRRAAEQAMFVASDYSGRP